MCQTVPGKIVDPAISALLVELMTPMTLDVALAVQQELETRVAETDDLRRQHIERLHYEADPARRRYMKVDPTVSPPMRSRQNGTTNCGLFLRRKVASLIHRHDRFAA